MAIAESIDRWAKRVGPIAAVRRLETSGGRMGADGDDGWGSVGWAGLAELGIFAIGIPEEIGGAGGTTADVAVVVEQLAAVLAPGPVLPTLLAGLVLGRSAQTADEDM